MRASLPFKWEGSWAAKALALGDTSQAIDLLNRSMRHQPLDADIHRRMAALTRGRPQTLAVSEVEAFAARTLSRRPRSRRSDPVRSAAPSAAETSAASVH